MVQAQLNHVILSAQPATNFSIHIVHRSVLLLRHVWKERWEAETFESMQRYQSGGLGLTLL